MLAALAYNIFLGLFITLFVLVSLLLILIILIQKGRGGGLASAFGGGGGNTAFGSKTGDVLTWATSIIFGVFLLLAVILNLMTRHGSEADAGGPAAAVPSQSSPLKPAAPATPPPTDTSTSKRHVTGAGGSAGSAASSDRRSGRPTQACGGSDSSNTRTQGLLRMIVSMTGFGDATAERDGTHYAVEIRSLNNRFFKPVIKLPDNVSGLEPELETMLREQLGRGSITYILKMRSDTRRGRVPDQHAGAEGLPRAAAARSRARTARRDRPGGAAGAARRLPGAAGRDRRDRAARADGPRADGQGDRQAQRDAAREGEALFNDLMKHAKVISTNLAEIAKRAPFVIDDYHKRLRSG